jgi:hypothetical protein
MIRRTLKIAAAVIVTVVLAACSDVTGPKNACPMSSGSGVCTS